LWTFSTLGWPEETEDFETYHPTNVLETGYDIIFFWVARMILMTTYLLGDIPFQSVYLHGLVRDGKGRKISKSLGNNIDPTILSEKYGTDALRMSLIVGVPPGNDNNLSEEKIRAYKKFANKIWNASRFVVSNIEDFDKNEKPNLTKKDTKILQELEELTKDITKDLENFRLYLGAEKLYHYFWHTFADIIIEESKPKLEGGDDIEKRSCQYMLYTVLTTNLKLLHPFMPFITEEIWNNLSEDKESLLMVEKWPT
ncbi:MAG: class I tRNA ligase family protein, partial [Candidatus Pacebacteria bacterium]|nr:class I tRNA ligase family protein [Candidatus Paceibacterota bacterium]